MWHLTTVACVYYTHQFLVLRFRNFGVEEEHATGALHLVQSLLNFLLSHAGEFVDS